MSRQITTVIDAWREYSVGIGGRPSVKSQYEGANTAYRKNDTERKFYQRRMILITELKHLAEELSLPPEEVARLMDAKRREYSPALSLDRVRQEIVAKRFVLSA